jgi:hypothetical protein
MNFCPKENGVPKILFPLQTWAAVHIKSTRTHVSLRKHAPKYLGLVLYIFSLFSCKGAEGRRRKPTATPRKVEFVSFFVIFIFMFLIKFSIFFLVMSS